MPCICAVTVLDLLRRLSCSKKNGFWTTGFFIGFIYTCLRSESYCEQMRLCLPLKTGAMNEELHLVSYQKIKWDATHQGYSLYTEADVRRLTSFKTKIGYDIPSGHNSHIFTESAVALNQPTLAKQSPGCPHYCLNTAVTSVLKAVHFVSVITCGTILAISAWPSCYKKWHTPLTARVASLSTENYRKSQTKLPSSSKNYRTVDKILSIWKVPRKTWGSSNI